MATPATTLSLAELAGVTRAFAERVQAGEFAVEECADERWHVRIHADDQVDVWLISWTTDQGTELHDHGGSAGAFTVVDGTLTESVWARGRFGATGELTDLHRSAGETVTFGTHYVHDVRNTDIPVAVSVHAYSPPLRLMHYYDYSAGVLVERASQWTEDPEAPSPDRPDRIAS
ncbi:cysteine dioxygenase [Nocardioides sp. Kera G14]|uniref:cysteine dioxygenase n=1 Tax=Nocardioides sp. Kera G14 TaxID=2884264 RepID=UPI001D1296B4|nr:cysteine dioxygenase family protein [Nocardioides sp. Kera G14]UDY24452.1 cysteine dioxygenase family protein [Nocardioides sp. Kera G14]